MVNAKNLDLIDRNAALEAICMYCCARDYDECPDGRCVDYRIVSDLPKVNAVVHGRWEYDVACEPYCSNCGSYALQLGFEKEKSNYCPNCGAYMRDGDSW